MDTHEGTTGEWSAAAKIFLALSIVGALNWGLIGFFNFNLVTAIFGVSPLGGASTASRIVYAVVGLAGLAALFVTPWGTRRLGRGVHFHRGARANP